MPFGLRIDVIIEQIGPDKPAIYKYVYSLDSLKFKEWLEENKYLCEGPLAFTAKGIQIMVINGATKWDKTEFTMDDNEGNRMYLNLLHEDIVIYVHRDLFAGKEWEIVLEDADTPF